ncbi:MAG: folate family ECF transporter S component [Erysipelotrichaceae bacterium]
MTEAIQNFLTMPIMVQVLAVLAILVIGFLTFKFNPLKLELRAITFTALMVMLSVVLSIFSLMVPMFGYPSLKIGLSQLPLMMVGLFYGPSWAFVAGLVEDVLELLTASIGFPFFGFTLNKILIAMIPALWMLIPKTKLKQFKYLPHTMLAGFWALAMIFVASINEVKIGKDLVSINLQTKLGIFLMSTVLVGFMIFMLNVIAKQYERKENRFSLTDWVVIILLVELVVNLILTPIWLQTMYGIPFLLNVAPRLVKGTVMIQVNIVLGYFIVNLIERLLKRGGS